MKKLFTIGAASVAALGALGGSVFAAPITTQGETPINATYNVDSAFVVTIPASITFSSANTSVDDTIAASNLLLDAEKALIISMKSTNGKLMNTVDSYIPYSYTLDESTTSIAANTDYKLLSIEAGNKAGTSKDITFTAGSLDNVTLAGLHSDTLTFKVAVEAPKTMQNIAKLTSSFSGSNTEQILEDTRDGKKYYVAKLADGNIWMTQNLEYIPSGKTWTDGYWPSDGAIFTDGSATTVGGSDAHYSRGTHYNWNAASSACPEGWELPSKTQYENLISVESLNKSTILSAPFYASRGGVVSNGSLGTVGQNGYYWTSTPGDDSKAYEVYFAQFISLGLQQSGVVYGDAVRCIAQ